MRTGSKIDILDGRRIRALAEIIFIGLASGRSHGWIVFIPLPARPAMATDARCLGHDIAEVGPALTPVIIKDHALPDLAGLSISNIVLSLHRTKKIREARGDILFTHQGLSGPVILDLSRFIRAGDRLLLSFAPAKERPALERWLLREAGQEGSRLLKSVLADLPGSVPLPPKADKMDS